jgi:citrate synthase
MSAVTELGELFIKMHEQGAIRECASTVILAQTFKVNGCNSAQSIIAAICSMGGMHAPLVAASKSFDYIMSGTPSEISEKISDILLMGKVPGWGSSFVKGEPDPIHAEIDAAIKRYASKQHYYIVEATHILQELTKKKLHPNTALYSAVYANILNIDPVLLPGLAIEARIPVWNHLMKQQIKRIRSKQEPE